MKIISNIKATWAAIAVAFALVGCGGGSGGDGPEAQNPDTQIGGQISYPANVLTVRGFEGHAEYLNSLGEAVEFKDASLVPAGQPEQLDEAEPKIL